MSPFNSLKCRIKIPYSHILVSEQPAIDRTFACSRGAASVFPLYLYAEETAATLFDDAEMSDWPWDEGTAGVCRI